MKQVSHLNLKSERTTCKQMPPVFCANLYLTSSPNISILIQQKYFIFFFNKIFRFKLNQIYLKQPEVEKWLEYVCTTVMPAPIKNECSSFVQEYGPIVIALLIKEVNPNQICSFIGVCPKQDTEQNMIAAQIEQDLYKHRIRELEEENKEEEQAKQEIEMVRKDKMSCSVCKYVIKYISTELKVDRTDRTVKFVFGNVCKLVPRSFKQRCNSFIEKHGVKVVASLDKFADEEKFCQSFGMCDEQEPNAKRQKQEKVIDSIQMVNLKPAEKLDENKLNSKNDSLQCSLCIYAAQIVDNLLKQNKTQQQVIAELKLVCNLFPSDLRDQCSSFINEYGPYVVQLIAADLNPQTACAALKLCDKTLVEKESLRFHLTNKN